jgi:hypothetical protein
MAKPKFGIGDLVIVKQQLVFLGSKIREQQGEIVDVRQGQGEWTSNGPIYSIRLAIDRTTKDFYSNGFTRR